MKHNTKNLLDCLQRVDSFSTVFQLTRKLFIVGGRNRDIILFKINNQKLVVFKEFLGLANSSAFTLSTVMKVNKRFALVAVKCSPHVFTYRLDMKLLRLTLLPTSPLLKYHLQMRKANSLYHKVPILIASFTDKEMFLNYTTNELEDVVVARRSEGPYYAKKLVRVNANLVFTEYRLGHNGVTRIAHY